MASRLTNMDEKISLKAVDQYSEAFAAAMASVFFTSKEKITGPEILKLCEIKQVNLFVLRELMHTWKVESQKLKSPYFNYGAEEVVQALQHFQNVLSNHISISRGDFFPLLTRAVSQTLYVVLDPYDFYSDVLDRQGNGYVNVSHLRSDIKYLNINRPPLERLVQKLEEKKLVTISGNEAFALLDSILEEVNFTPEDIDTYLEQFSRITPLELEKLYEPKVIPPPKAEAAKPLPDKKSETASASEHESRTIATHFQKISKIKDSLTINQKFMFTKILFNGDFEIFSQSIDRLDRLDNLTQALSYLDNDYPEWDKESVEYVEFREIVEKRFA
jgi:hypothetical protein